MLKPSRRAHSLPFQEIDSESSLELRIAQRGFPAGAVVHCELCGYRLVATTEQVAEFLDTWPRHCGYRMEMNAIASEQTSVSDYA